MIQRTVIIAILSIQSSVFAQPIQHFESLDARWYVAETYPDANQQDPTFVATTTTVYGYQGDTTINGKAWNKLYMTDDAQFQNGLSYIGSSRFDNDQVLFRDTTNQLDTLYDFSLNAGDSVLYNISGINQEWLDILAVDSVQLNGNYYKRFHFDEPSVAAFDWLDEIWIEGIGSIHGPLFPKYPRKFSTEIPDSMLLTCSFASDEQVWQHTDYSNCYESHVWNLSENANVEIITAPNPFENAITIQAPQHSIEKITLLSQLGTELKTIADYKSGQKIDLSFLQSGIYFLKIQVNRNTTTQRIIKY